MVFNLGFAGCQQPVCLYRHSFIEWESGVVGGPIVHHNNFHLAGRKILHQYAANSLIDKMPIVNVSISPVTTGFSLGVRSSFP